MAKVTVLIATRNRASILRETLEAMTRVRREGPSVEWVVVNNGSVDRTEAVLDTFAERLPLRRLFAPAAGKALALNHALAHVELGEIVVFTDDDITPGEDWLEAILETCGRWPKHHVFGGPIEPLWPSGLSVPPWARHEIIQTLAFARHEFPSGEGEYPADIDPFGGNFWVRRGALAGVRFLEKIGAREKHQRLGEETQLHRQLRRRGHVPVYAPGARVLHRIQPSRVTKAALYRRALQGGLGVAYVHGLPDKSLFQRARARWWLDRMRMIVKSLDEFREVVRLPDENDRVVQTTRLIWSIAEHGQALRLSLTTDASLREWISQGPESATT